MNTAAVCLGTLVSMMPNQTFARLAPYPAIRWQETRPEVRLDNAWYELLAIDGHETATIVKFAQQKYQDRWQKRFDEDLVEVLSGMGHPPGKSVKLTLRDPKSGTRRDVDAPLTAENRRALMDFKYGGRSGPAGAVDLRLALDDFEKALRSQWSYYHLSKQDIDKGIANLRPRLEGMSVNDFGLELQKIIALGIDGHASVGGFRTAGGYLPFLCEWSGERLVAFRPDRRALVDPDHPYLVKLDGRDVADWLKAAATFIPKGSPQYVRNHSIRGLRDVQFLRKQLGLREGTTVDIELASADGTRKQLELPIADRPPTFGIWPARPSGLIDGDVGYLRLPTMNSRAVQDIRTWMPKFQGAKGLIVDVRDNGGGSRDALLWLFSYLASPQDAPRVVNAAAYRLHDGFKDNHLAARFMYRVDSSNWTQAERQAIKTFAARFQPAWQPPPKLFSDWHYLVLSPLNEKEIYHYDKPVVVLLNAKCFSATDIFLAGLKGCRNVTLLGVPSGGGSAFAHTVRLNGAPVSVRLGSMISFQRDGQLFDGHGVQPDIIVEPAPEYFIGGADNMLDAALQRVRGK